MARYGAVATGSRILVLLLLVVVLGLGGLIWFDFLGLLNIKETFSPLFSLMGLGTPKEIEDIEDVALLEKERLSKLQEAMDLREQELDTREAEILQKEGEIHQIIETLEEREMTLEEQEKTFNNRVREYENRNVNLRKISQYLVGMPPDKAIERLIEMDDQDVIDILRITDSIALEAGEDSITSYWLSLMPAERAATVNRKMLKKPAAAGG
ncbi:MAG: flagellar protein FlbB [Spirochaetales bacterium]|nr:flagellar protein FlbB [Spirochaetales bacterium]